MNTDKSVKWVSEDKKLSTKNQIIPSLNIEANTEFNQLFIIDG